MIILINYSPIIPQVLTFRNLIPSKCLDQIKSKLLQLKIGPVYPLQVIIVSSHLLTSNIIYRYSKKNVTVKF